MLGLRTDHLKCKIHFRFIIHLMCVLIKMKHTDLYYFHMQLTWLHRSRSWSRSHNRFLVSILVSHSLVSVLALVSLCFGLINKPGLNSFMTYNVLTVDLFSHAWPWTFLVRLELSDDTSTKFERNRTIRRWVLDDLPSLCHRFLANVNACRL